MPKLEFIPRKQFVIQRNDSNPTINTIFQNTSGLPILVSGIISLLINNGTTGVIVAETDSNNPPTTIVTEALNDTVFGNSYTLTFIVKPNNFYRLRAVSGGNSGSFGNTWV